MRGTGAERHRPMFNAPTTPEPVFQHAVMDILVWKGLFA